MYGVVRLYVEDTMQIITLSQLVIVHVLALLGGALLFYLRTLKPMTANKSELSKEKFGSSVLMSVGTYLVILTLISILFLV